MYCGVIMSRNSQPAGTPHFVQLEQELARDAQAVVDAEAAVEIGIVDQAFPADGRARLLEINAHDDQQIGGQLRCFASCSRAAYSLAAFSRGSSRAP